MNDESQKEKLRQHFARRVTTQARVVLDTWQKISENRGQAESLRELFAADTDKLVRYALRFEMNDHAVAGKRILQLLASWAPGSALDDNLAAQLQEATGSLCQSTQRRSDQATGQAPQQYRRTPVYIALDNSETANRLIRQLEFFG
ncbi:MAG TPA: diguanylate cyclase response regulator, partial [Marinobacter sp.]|nr:diguanylate cyclase response regulator [Marinobacter sp.]